MDMLNTSPTSDPQQEQIRGTIPISLQHHGVEWAFDTSAFTMLIISWNGVILLCNYECSIYSIFSRTSRTFITRQSTYYDTDDA